MTSLRKMLDAGHAGKPLLGLSVMYPSPGAVERVGPDWDWMWIDGQHGQMGYDQTFSLVRACDLIQRPAVVRAFRTVGGRPIRLRTAASWGRPPRAHSVRAGTP